MVLLMTEETGGSYKLVIYLSRSCLVVCQSSVAEADKTSLEADQKEEMRCESLHLYYEIKDENDKIPLRFYYILKTYILHFTRIVKF